MDHRCALLTGRCQLDRGFAPLVHPKEYGRRRPNFGRGYHSATAMFAVAFLYISLLRFSRICYLL